MSRTHVLSTMSSPGNARWRFCRNNLEESAAQCDLTWQDALVGWLVIARLGVLQNSPWIFTSQIPPRSWYISKYDFLIPYHNTKICHKHQTSFPFRPRRCPIWLHHPRHAGWKCSCLVATVSARSRKTEPSVTGSFLRWRCSSCHFPVVARSLQWEHVWHTQWWRSQNTIEISLKLIRTQLDVSLFLSLSL